MVIMSSKAIKQMLPCNSKRKLCHFFTSIHCFVNKNNLVVTLLDLLLMHQLEGILQKLYSIFAHDPNKFVEFQMLVDFLNNKGNKLLNNVI
jgi:hypothetical protein